MIGIIDYGMGNLKSVANAFASLGFDAFIASSPKELDRAGHVVLPGVGAFQGAIETLERQGWVPRIMSVIDRGLPFLGICLGMQLLFETSEENGAFKGLGIFPGHVVRIPDRGADGGRLKIPHMGWNRLLLRKRSRILGDDGVYVYFVHSYSALTDSEHISASAAYGAELTAAVERDNVYAVQFHPEKSGADGLEILRKFASLNGGAAR
ncbi:MAG: imidazole glycerol phosphate synthase subunit HisH [Synergistaceae bacterium]|jgi:glutamine amidotransferase|nr:imidazole glycerol phosphate synthase subunit HisH [Synergistaceae bacterium]